MFCTVKKKIFFLFINPNNRSYGVRVRSRFHSRSFISFKVPYFAFSLSRWFFFLKIIVLEFLDWLNTNTRTILYLNKFWSNHRNFFHFGIIVTEETEFSIPRTFAISMSLFVSFRLYEPQIIFLSYWPLYALFGLISLVT